MVLLDAPGAEPAAPAAGAPAAAARRRGEAPSGRVGGSGRADLGRGGRIAGLDGLRALAVTAVVVYHLGAPWLPGGFLGVDLFFVISGFLITTLLLVELEAAGRIDLRSFYLRRARRLLPALLVTLGATLLLVGLFARDVAQQTARDVPGALLYVSNWWAIGQQQSYFELIGRGNVLGHLWSLAVEEQFYLVWPLLVGGLGLVAARRGPGLRRLVLLVALGGAVASSLLMAVIAVGSGMPIESDPTRVYFGTDTHAMSVLAGAALAAVWRVTAFRADVAPGARRVLVGAGLLGLLGCAWLVTQVSEYTPWLYRGGFLLAAALFALVVAATTHPASPLGRWLDNPGMRWVGQRSYGIYLIHWPVFLLTRPGADLPLTGLSATVLRVSLVLGLAEASYRFVETPVRRGALARWWRSRRAGRPGLRAALEPRGPAERRLALAALVAVLLTAGLIGTAPSAQEVAAAQALGGTNDVVDAADSGPPATTGALGEQMSWYGDSVSLWSVGRLRTEFPGLRVDAGLNRSPGFILNRVEQDRAAGSLRPIVVMHLGNAGPVPTDQLESTLAALTDRQRIVLINSNARFPYVPQGNATIAAVAATHPNTVVVDWMADSSGHPEWFEDGLHLTEAGKPEFAAAVRAAIEGDVPG